MEMVAEVKTLMVYMQCDKCGNGLMEQNGAISYKNEVARYPHKCNSCGYEINYDVPYPYQRMVPVELLRKPKENEVG